MNNATKTGIVCGARTIGMGSVALCILCLGSVAAAVNSKGAIGADGITDDPTTVMAYNTPRVWQPKPAPRDAATEARRVVIAKQGMEHNRNMDGNAHGIASFHRYRIDRDPKTRMWDVSVARDDVQQFHDLDVDGDGQTQDDTVACHPFDLDPANPMSMIAPWYDTTVGTQRWFGGAAIYQANTKSSGFSEDGMNDAEEGEANQPRRNWTLFHETIEIGSPYRMCYLLLWLKDDFISGGDRRRVGFDDSCELRCWLGR